LDEAGPMKVLLLQNIYRYRVSIGMTVVTGGLITVTNHELSNGNAVMFTGSGMPGLFKNKTYYVSEVHYSHSNTGVT